MRTGAGDPLAQAARTRRRTAVPPAIDPASNGTIAAAPSPVDTSQDLSLERMGLHLPDTILFQLVTDRHEDGSRTRRLTFVGANSERIIGIPSDAIMEDGTLVYRAMDPADVVRLHALQEQAIELGEPMRMRALARVGSVPVPGFASPARRDVVLDISAAPTPLGGDRLLWSGSATDVTQAVRGSAERDRLIQVVEVAQDLVAVMRTDGVIEYLNAAGRRMLGLEPSDPLPPAAALWPRGERAETMRDAVLTAARHGSWSGDTVIQRPDGTELPVSEILVAHRAPAGLGRRTGRISHFSAIMRDATRAAETERALREAGERTSIELREVGHRVKNLFALVPAIIALSGRTATSVEEFAEAARERVEALGRAHSMTLMMGARSDGTELASLAAAVLDPYADQAERLHVGGPAVTLAGPIASTIGLCLHELATNAAKYGALLGGADSAENGRVDLTWKREGETLEVSWGERDGPKVAPPSRRGFGTSLIDRVISTQGGTIERDWREEGLCVRIVLPMI